MSYSCCSTPCDFCSKPICECTCEASKQAREVTEEKAKFADAYYLIAKHLIAFAEARPHKLCTLQFNTSGIAMYGQLRAGFKDADQFLTPEALWILLTSPTTSPTTTP